MSRISRLPYHQNLYDLVNVVTWNMLPGVECQIAEWERKNGRAFPAAMREFYTTAVTVHYGGDKHIPWTLTLPELWAEYSNSDHALSVPAIFEYFVPLRHLRIPAPPAPGFQIMWENQGCWVLCARDDGCHDPLIDASSACILSTMEELTAMVGWHSVGRFTEMLCAWFADYYLADYAPLSFCSAVAPRPEFEWEQPPAKSYANGLWLRTPAEPFDFTAIETLINKFGEPERRPRHGNITTYTFRPSGCIIRVTADAPALDGALSAWWIHADTRERLAHLGQMILPIGTLRETLRADTEQAREVLRMIL